MDQTKKINIEYLEVAARKIAKRYDLRLLVLFGSQVSGHTHRQSDIDIGFTADADYGPGETVRIEMALQDAAKMGPIELVNLKNVSPLLLKYVARDGRLLYEKRRMGFAEFRIEAFKRAMEARPLLVLQQMSLHRYLQRV